jgi:hypothetical protein
LKYLGLPAGRDFQPAIALFGTKKAAHTGHVPANEKPPPDLAGGG